MNRCYSLPWPVLCAVCVLCGQLAAAEPSTRPAASQPAVDILDRVSCSSLVQCKHPLEPCLRTVAKLGYKYVDLSCLSWEPRHASAQALVKDFEAEATRVENALKENDLKVSNLTFDSVEARPWDQYQAEFAAVVKLAVRLKARLINLMAPSAKAKWDEQIPKLRQLVATAKQAGVILTVETHTGQITELPANAEKLCKEVPGLGLTLDPSHYYAGPNQGKPFKNLYPYVQGTGFRAGGMSWATVQMPWGEGPIDFAEIVRDLEAGGYKGYYVVEYLEGHNKLDAPTEAKKFLNWARQLSGKSIEP